MSHSTPGNSPNSAAGAQNQQDWNYEATVIKVETIINRVESGQLQLAEVFDQFATAVEYLGQCEAFLQERQQQMDLLIETLIDEPGSF